MIHELLHVKDEGPRQCERPTDPVQQNLLLYTTSKTSYIKLCA